MNRRDSRTPPTRRLHARPARSRGDTRRADHPACPRTNVAQRTRTGERLQPAQHDTLRIAESHLPRTTGRKIASPGSRVSRGDESWQRAFHSCPETTRSRGALTSETVDADRSRAPAPSTRGQKEPSTTATATATRRGRTGTWIVGGTDEAERCAAVAGRGVSYLPFDEPQSRLATRVRAKQHRAGFGRGRDCIDFVPLRRPSASARPPNSTPHTFDRAEASGGACSARRLGIPAGA